MDISHREELISAYLDGELSAAEQQQVLQLLSEDEAANKLFSEFQLLRESLRTLPAEQLNEDFMREVIERVKQRSPEPLPASLSQDVVRALRRDTRLGPHPPLACRGSCGSHPADGFL